MASDALVMLHQVLLCNGDQAYEPVLLIARHEHLDPES